VSARRRLPEPDGTVRIAPSLLAADFGRLADSVAAMEKAGCDWVSVDVMDGHFVPNLSFGPDLVKSLRPKTQAAIDAHLMVTDPLRFAAPFVDAGADLVIAHVEACDGRAWIREIHSRGALAGLAIKPATPVEKLVPYLDELDLALVMTVEPGFGGQAFRQDMMPKLRSLREAAESRKSKAWIMVDGGVNDQTVIQAAEAGADAFVAGTSVFRAKDPGEAFRSLRQRAQEAFDRRLHGSRH
jgi:ribulose-phosphate 3-epimerase